MRERAVHLCICRVRWRYGEGEAKDTKRIEMGRNEISNRWPRCTRTMCNDELQCSALAYNERNKKKKTTRTDVIITYMHIASEAAREWDAGQQSGRNEENGNTECVKKSNIHITHRNCEAKRSAKKLYAMRFWCVWWYSECMKTHTKHNRQCARWIKYIYI